MTLGRGKLVKGNANERFEDPMRYQQKENVNVPPFFVPLYCFFFIIHYLHHRNIDEKVTQIDAIYISLSQAREKFDDLFRRFFFVERVKTQTSRLKFSTKIVRHTWIFR